MSGRRGGLGRYLSYVLRHDPADLGLVLEAGGWVQVVDLLAALNRRPGSAATVEDLREVVRTDSKGRFSLSEDETRMRANQGHSTEVDLQLAPATPPEHLYHGTSLDLFWTIMSQGLRKMQRHHVHLSADIVTARQVASRRPRPVVFYVFAAAHAAAGAQYYLSDNGVWLVDAVPPDHLILEKIPGKMGA